MTKISREDLLEKGLSQEQITDILNMFHETNQENVKLQSQIDGLKGFETKYNDAQKQLDDIKLSNMTEQQKLEEALKNAQQKEALANKIYNTAKAKEILAGYDVGDDLIAKLVDEDEASTIASANMLKIKLDAWSESATKKAKEDMQNIDVKPAPSNVPPVDDSMTLEKFNKLSMLEQKIWKDEHLDEYHEMVSQK